METQEHLNPELSTENVQTAPSQESEQDALAQYGEMSQSELIDAARKLLSHKPISEVREQMDFIKQMFYKKRPLTAKIEMTEEEEEQPVDNQEEEFKEVFAEYKRIKGEENAAAEIEQNENLKKKNDILAQLAALISSNDDLSETIPAFRKLQAEWKQIGRVSLQKENEIWKEYNHFLEKFYDLIKINNDLRDYDLKKNYELKSALCESAEALDQEEDIVKAFRTLQTLHDQWREIGPVLYEERENVWNRFKAASSVINKKHQLYFDELKSKEEELLQERIALCEKVENIDYSTLTNYKLWDEKSKEVIALNAFFKWDTPMSRRINNKVFKRFRSACDRFFEARYEFFKTSKEELNDNLQKKRALCEQAEALKTSTDWKSTTEKLVALQKEWKQIGPVPKKQSDVIWKRFITACDFFFEQKEKNFSSKKSVETDNMKQKMAVIEEIKQYVITGNDNADLAALKALNEKYNAIGHVPFKEKDKVYRLFKETIDKRFMEVKSRLKMQEISLSKDRSKLMKKYDQLRNEISTYENNIGFFNNSKKANSLIDEMQRKLEHLKTELAAVMVQIDALDKQDK